MPARSGAAEQHMQLVRQAALYGKLGVVVASSHVATGLKP